MLLWPFPALCISRSHYKSHLLNWNTWRQGAFREVSSTKVHLVFPAWAMSGIAQWFHYTGKVYLYVFSYFSQIVFVFWLSHMTYRGHFIRKSITTVSLFPLIHTIKLKFRFQTQNSQKVNPLFVFFGKRHISEAYHGPVCLQKIFLVSFFILMHKVFVKYDMDGIVWLCLCTCVLLCVL